MKKIIIVTLMLFLITIPNFTITGSEGVMRMQENEFNDVDDETWFYDSVQKMQQNEIISGYEDGSFRPFVNVKRNEYAKLLTKTLQLNLSKPKTPTFEDVPINSWEYVYVETAKRYLTGYSMNSKYYFEPTEETLREDIIVALVKGLNYELIKNVEETLKPFKDNDKISPNLRPYMATAINKNIISGYEENGVKLIRPLKPINRAETAHLLSKILEKEKIIFDDKEKITFENYKKNEEIADDELANKEDLDISKIDLNVRFSVDEDYIILEWKNIEKAKGYKVVASEETDSKLIYPHDGNFMYTEENKVKIYFGQKYNGGDFHQLEKNQEYYFNINIYTHEGKAIPTKTVKISTK